MRKRNRVMGLAVGCIAAFLYLGCTQTPGTDPNDQQNQDQQNTDTTGTQTAKPEKSSDLIKFNMSKGSVLATTGLANHERSAGRAAGDNLDSLVAITEDNEVVNVMETSKELQDWCVPKKVVEVYQCPYASVEESCKGVYTVFESAVDNWKFKDDTPAPGMSMLMYVKPDGTAVDVLNIDGDVSHYVQTYIKANYGNDYIKFDKQGNAFILADDGSNSVVYRYNPVNDVVTKYDLGLKSDSSSVWIGNFEVSGDGKWVFVKADIKNGGKTVSTVYTMEVNAQKTPVKIFESKPDFGYVVSMAYNDSINTLYFRTYADAGDISLADETCSMWGLYELAKRSDDSFNVADLKKHNKLPDWLFCNLAKKYIIDEFKDAEGNSKYKAKTDPDYTGFVAALKKLVCYDGDPEDLVIDLSFFKTDVWVAHFGESARESIKASVPDDITDAEAIEWLVENNIYFETNWFTDFVNKIWHWEKSFRTEQDIEAGRYPYFLEALVHGKDGKKVIDPYCYGSKDFTGDCAGAFAFNNDGVWTYTNKGEESWNGDTHAILYKLADRKGNFELSQPAGFAGKRLYIASPEERDDSDPWYKKPYAVTPTAVAALSEDRKSIYYYSNGTVKDLLENDSNKSSINMIYSFTLNDTEMVYNAVKNNGGYMMVRVDLATGAATKLPLEVRVENMLAVK